MSERRADQPGDEPVDEVEDGDLDDARPSPVQRHDLLVVIGALALLALGGLIYRASTSPTLIRFQREALSFERPRGWLPPEPVPAAEPRLASRIDPLPLPPPEEPAPETGRKGKAAPDEPIEPDPEPSAPPPATEQPDIFHVVYTAPVDPTARLEIRIAERPHYSNLRGTRSFSRRTRYGELYWAAEGRRVTIHGHDWLRTRFRYAHKPGEGGAPQIASAIEYATVLGKRLYVVTVHGDDRQVRHLDDLIAPTLEIDSRAGTVVPLAANEDRGDRVEAVAAAMPAAVLVMAVDEIGGELHPVSSGSGTIVSAGGSVLTNLHVVWDEAADSPHDLFVIGRYQSGDRDPVLVCAGRPGRSKWLRELDLALLQCDLDMNGQRWSPSNWPTVPIGRGEPLFRGERVWVIGFPDVGGGAIRVTSGQISGWISQGDRIELIRSDAGITHGNSGGTAVDQEGRLIGVPTAFRELHLAGQPSRSVGEVGLIRPIELAAPLLRVARTAWQPEPGENQVSMDPTAGEDLPDPGVVVRSRVIDAANDEPIPGAVVVVFRPDIKARTVDFDRLEEQALSWGQTNTGGEFTLGRGVPRGNTYTVAVMAQGYQTLTADDVLPIGPTTPALFDPWGQIRLDRHE